MKNEYFQSGRVSQKLETRDRILKAAQFFMHQGSAFTLEDVARHAGISRATVYRYYSNVEILSGEAGLDLNTLSPEAVHERVSGKDLPQQLREIQEYYNQLAMDHENLFRKYLSIAVTADSPVNKRGARRIRTLQLVLENADLPAKDKTRLAHLLTVIMGIEPMIVTRDVCGLSDKESIKLLRWGMELILKGLAADKILSGE